ncbi:sodium/glucose cotransporter 4-like [Gigantopelta aegis]|uniref:sodium/glucose cotransporter 4-like n=1 Tax=Gigantopelta aegis TaxID=1735272 RepID=UPI001B88A6BB|nr:sodium/glucose cotransporter 4-like [Gigantopelta aegis]
MTWFPVGASMFSSNIGSEHFIGLAGVGAASGTAMILYEWSSMPLMFLLGWIFLPVYISSGAYTLPEYIEKRCGGRRLRLYLSCLSLFMYVVTKLSVSIYAGALFIKLALGWDMYISIAGLLLVTSVYTILGGLTAVIYTDTFQTVVMVIGAVVLTVIGFHEVGGLERLEVMYMNSTPSVGINESTTCGKPREDAFHIFRDAVTGDQPWPGLLIQSSLGCLWYWCCDQVIVQRTLAAKSLSHGKAGALMAGYLKFLPLFLMVYPGMISRVLFTDSVGCVNKKECERYCENPLGCTDIAYPKLVLEILPTGLRGLLMAVMLSAIMSSLTSIFNSSSTLFTMDLWRRMRPRANQRELLIVGRCFILVMCAASILWIPLVRSSQRGQLFNYINAMQGYLGTPTGILFLFAVLWKRTNENGAFWGIIIGNVCGMIRLALDIVYPAPPCGQPETRPEVVYLVHYTYFSCLNMVITAAAIIIFSLLSKKPSEQQLKNVTFWTKLKMSEDPSKKTDGDNEYANPMTVATEDDEDPTEQIQEGRCHKLFDFVCGIPTTRNTKSHEFTEEEKRDFLREDPKWQTILNVNALVGIAVMAFLMGFFH